MAKATAKSGETTKRVRSIAGRVLATGKFTDAEVRILAASCVSQAPNVVQAMLDASDDEQHAASARKKGR